LGPKQKIKGPLSQKTKIFIFVYCFLGIVAFLGLKSYLIEGVDRILCNYHFDTMIFDMVEIKELNLA
jgi:hypothetical protein